MTIKQFLVEISQVLDKLEIDYAISGGVAISVWGRPRHTADLDIVIKINTREKIELLVDKLLGAFKVGYLDKEAAIRAYQEKGEFNLVEPEYGLKADFFIIGEEEYQKKEIERAVKKKIGKTFVSFIAPEDLIIAKLRWYKMSPSDRQLEDVKAILNGSKLDNKYLNLWIKKLGFEEEWEKAQ